jgi:hypothetical protein
LIAGPPPLEGFIHGAFLGDVVKSLGKSHAFAIVVRENVASQLLQALLENMKLSSFIVAVDPVLDGLEVDSLFAIFHPTFLPYDRAAPAAVIRSVKTSTTVLPDVVTLKSPTAAGAAFYESELACASATQTLVAHVRGSSYGNHPHLADCAHCSS